MVSSIDLHWWFCGLYSLQYVAILPSVLELRHFRSILIYILLGLIDIQQAFVQFRGVDTQLNRKLAYIAEVLYYTIQACLKLSILHFYWRLFKSTNLRHWILGFTLIAILWSGAAVRQVRSKM